MRGEETQQSSAFSYVSAEERIPADHPLRAIRRMTDEVLERLGPVFGELYASTGRPSIPPERLLRALLLQALYTIRSERLLMEQLNYNFLFRWFVGMDLDEKVWAPTVFTKNRDRLLDGDVAGEFFSAVVDLARQKRLLSDEHFTVDGTMIERVPAWLENIAGQRNTKYRGEDRVGWSFLFALAAYDLVRIRKLEAAT